MDGKDNQEIRPLRREPRERLSDVAHRLTPGLPPVSGDQEHRPVAGRAVRHLRQQRAFRRHRLFDDPEQ